MNENCKDCKWVVPVYEHIDKPVDFSEENPFCESTETQKLLTHYECRESSKTVSGWPIVLQDDFCGKFVRRSISPDEWIQAMTPKNS
ncbi:MAG: hypothetical protein HKK67_09010 [Chlorobiaceae bacterium]|nr:hypothetical protein [Chlorobiaceae bacterium]NMW21753.1 hypothetical protein [Chlorobiaceae bacterium]